MKYKILLVEDEPEMRSGLQDNLEFEGYEVESAENGEQAIELLKVNSYDLVVSDVMMPKVSGFDVARFMQTQSKQTGLILLTARTQELDRVRGLELGADDYISKPFSLMEFMARVKAVLRRYTKQQQFSQESTSSSQVQFGLARILPETLQVFVGENEVNMSHKEIELMLFFAKKAQKVVSRDELLTAIWGYQDLPTTRTVDNFILRLRQKIEIDPANPRHLITVHGIGYKFLP